MSQRGVRGRSSLLKWGIVGCTVLVLLTGQVSTWVEAMRSNVVAVEATRQLVNGDVLPVDQQVFTLSADCRSYPGLIQYYYATKDQRPEDALQALTAQQACSQHSRLLKPLQGELLAKLGRSQESCAVLSEIKATALMLSLGQQARAAEDWESVATFLDCVEALKNQVSWWISPYIMGDLYYALGQHYETAGEAERALETYQHTIDWYPGWAGPIVRRANLLIKLNRSVEGITLLESALAQGGDTVARWELVNTLAPIWEEQNKLDYAYCAYQEAVTLIPDLPSVYEAEQLRPRLLEQINRLRAARTSLESTDCRKLLAAPAAQ